MTYTNRRDAALKIANCEPFKGNSLSGGNDPSSATGKMPKAWTDVYRSQMHLIDYVVRSYATPIAWHLEGQGWVVPNVRYSVTTTQQQGIVRAAVGVSL